jgi:hypothetical protein
MKHFIIIILTFVLILLFCDVSFHFSPKNNIPKINIIECFKNMEWRSQSFSCGGALLSDNMGNEKFYPAKDIDECIKCLNKEFNK